MLKKPNNIEIKYNSLVLVKFYEERKYVNDLIEGNLFMRSLESFSKLKDEGRSDIFENKSFIVVPGKDLVTEMKYIEKNGQPAFEFTAREKKEDEEGIYFLVNTKESKTNKIFSIYALWFNTQTGEIRDIDKKMIDNFGEYCCVIYKPEEFCERVLKKGKENITIDFVEYIDLNSNPIQDWHPFLKDKDKFSDQSELRILYRSNTDDETMRLDLGVKIDDIAVRCKSREFIDSFHIENGMLMIPIDKQELSG